MSIFLYTKIIENNHFNVLKVLMDPLSTSNPLSIIYAAFTVPENETKSETNTDNKHTEPNGNLYSYRSLCSMNASTQSYTSHFYRSRSRSWCRAMWIHHKLVSETQWKHWSPWKRPLFWLTKNVNGKISKVMWYISVRPCPISQKTWSSLSQQNHVYPSYLHFYFDSGRKT